MHVTTCVGTDRRSAALVAAACDEGDGVAATGTGSATTCAGRLDRERGSGERDRPAPGPPVAVV